MVENSTYKHSTEDGENHRSRVPGKAPPWQRRVEVRIENGFIISTLFYVNLETGEITDVVQRFRTLLQTEFN